MSSHQLLNAEPTPYGDGPSSISFEPQSSLHLLIAIGLGLTTGGFVSVVSHVAHLFVPSLVILGFLLVRPRIFGGLDARWMVFGTLLLLSSLVSATFAEELGTRSWGFAVFSTVPVLGFALTPVKRMLGFAEVYFLVAAIAMCAWTAAYYALVAEEFGPWQLSAASGSGNLYGAHLNMLWPMLLGFAMGSPRVWRRRLLYATAIGCIVSACLSFSRVAVATTAGLGALILFRRRPLRFVVLAALSVWVVLFTCWDSMLSLLRLYRLADFEAQYPRGDIWAYAWERAAEVWVLGTGPGGAPRALSDMEMYHAHNSILNTLLESGIVPAILMVGLTLYLGVVGVRSILRGGSALCFGCGILSYLAYSVVATPISRPELTLTLVLVVCACRYQLSERRGSLQPMMPPGASTC
ncbi:O-antigen ligase family protein [Planctomycetota bacterium]